MLEWSHPTGTGGIFDGVSFQYYDEFNALSDFIWKNMRFVSAELQSELGKITAYYPLVGDKEKDREAIRLRQVRAAFELPSILEGFPALILQGNFLCAISLFETACLAVCKKIEEVSALWVSDAKGMGLAKVISFLKSWGVDLRQVRYFEQVSASFEFRNCFIHANGLVDQMRQPKKILSIIEKKEHMVPYLRDRDGSGAVVDCRNTPLGVKLRLSHNYVHLHNTVLREAFLSLCQLANERSQPLTTAPVGAREQ